MRKVAGWSLVAASGYAALSYIAHRSVYFPMKYPGGWWSQQTALGAEDVWITTSDGVKLHAWWIAARESQLATLFLHGNAGNVTHRIHAIREIRDAGSSVLMLDYRGFGKSEGSPGESGLYRDADAAYEWLRQRGLDPSRIVIHGESLGTAVAVDLASRNPCRGLILEAPFPSARAVAARVLPLLGPLLVWGFDSKSKIGRVHAPLLVIHGDRDEVMDVSLGKELFAAANEPKSLWLVPGGGHNNLVEAAGAGYGRRLAEFCRLRP